MLTDMCRFIVYY